MTSVPSAAAPATAAAATGSPATDGAAKPEPVKAADSGGAFASPEPVTVTKPSGEKTTIAPTASTVAIDPSTGATTPVAKAPEIPKKGWREPMTVVEAERAHPNGSTFKARATYFTDGDTVHVQGNGDTKPLICRVQGIDAPETAHPSAGKAGQPYGEEAKQAIQRMIDDKEITIRISFMRQASQQGRNRALCDIEFEGKNLSREMVQAGAAMVYERYAKDPELYRLQGQAQRAKAGIWNFPEFSNPEKFRQMQNYGRSN